MDFYSHLCMQGVFFNSIDAVLQLYDLLISNISYSFRYKQFNFANGKIHVILVNLNVEVIEGASSETTIFVKCSRASVVEVVKNCKKLELFASLNVQLAVFMHL